MEIYPKISRYAEGVSVLFEKVVKKFLSSIRVKRLRWKLDGRYRRTVVELPTGFRKFIVQLSEVSFLKVSNVNPGGRVANSTIHSKLLMNLFLQSVTVTGYLTYKSVPPLKMVPF